MVHGTAYLELAHADRAPDGDGGSAVKRGMSDCGVR